MVELNQQVAAQMRQRDSRFPDVRQGILVTGVAANSPAFRCGLKEGDVITGSWQSITAVGHCDRSRRHSPFLPTTSTAKAANDKEMLVRWLVVECNVMLMNRANCVVFVCRICSTE